MLNNSFPTPETMPCRACGAVAAAKSGNSYNLCDNCWRSVVHVNEMWAGRGQGRGKRGKARINEAAVTRWMANRLRMDAERLVKTGISGRCEAISGWAYGRPGTQCATRAVEMRDGHKVCYRHARATDPQYVCTETSDPYIRFAEIIEELCGKDEKLAEAVRGVVYRIDRSAA